MHPPQPGRALALSHGKIALRAFPRHNPRPATRRTSPGPMPDRTAAEFRAHTMGCASVTSSPTALRPGSSQAGSVEPSPVAAFQNFTCEGIDGARLAALFARGLIERVQSGPDPAEHIVSEEARGGRRDTLHKSIRLGDTQRGLACDDFAACFAFGFTGCLDVFRCRGTPSTVACVGASRVLRDALIRDGLLVGELLFVPTTAASEQGQEHDTEQLLHGFNP